jgi:glycosyltransferase involved in cell wall biosynthesis
LSAVVYGTLTKTAVVVDAHNAALIPLEADGPAWLRWLCRAAVRHADLTIVTNDRLAEVVVANGGRPFVLPDRIPELPRARHRPRTDGRRQVMFICTFAPDEPYMNVLEAAGRLDPQVTVYMTGNPKHRAASLRAAAPSNVVFTGFIPEEEYIDLLQTSDAVIDLTTREDCLVCGAYEGVAAERPLILSGTNAIRTYFDQGVRYTDNSAEDLAQAMQDVLHSGDQATQAIRTLKGRLISDWRGRLQRLISTVNGMIAAGRNARDLRT